MEQRAARSQQTRIQKIPARDLALHAQGFVVAAVCASRPGTVHFFPPRVSVLPGFESCPEEPPASSVHYRANEFHPSRQPCEAVLPSTVFFSHLPWEKRDSVPGSRVRNLRVGYE